MMAVGTPSGPGDPDPLDDVRQLWKEFIADLWYGEIVWYKIYGGLRSHIPRNARQEQKMRKEASLFVMIENGTPRLTRRETNGELAECIRAHQVEKILHRFHDLHGHFACGVMSRNIIGRYYWPGRFRDISHWCETCNACQRLGPLKPSATLTPIMQLQPMDMIGINFIGPFNPISEGGGRYIIMAVDYFSHYLWARVAASNHGFIVEAFLEKDITQWFGWPLSAYLDNGSHFVKGVLPKIFRKQGVKLFKAPITNPSFVGLSERYVQLILAGLWAKVLSDTRLRATVLWHEHLPEIIHAINTRILRIHGYTPTQLFMGFNARMTAFDESVVDEAMRSILEHHVTHGIGSLEQWQYDLRVSQIAEIQELT